jgi:hypothetical protein
MSFVFSTGPDRAHIQKEHNLLARGGQVTLDPQKALTWFQLKAKTASHGLQRSDVANERRTNLRTARA